MDVILVAFLGYVLGAVFRTLYDFLWKALEDESVTFDTKYWVTMGISVIISVMSAAVTFTTLTIPVDGTTFVFIACLTTGFMVNHLVNKPVAYLSQKKG